MNENVVFVIPGKLGGSLSIVRDVVAARPDDAMPARVVLTDNVPDTDARAGAGGASGEIRFEYALPPENLYAVLRRLANALPPGPGVLVSNDWLELAMEHGHPSGRVVVQLLHGDHPYYYDLAARHDGVIDAFVTYSQAMAAALRDRLPHRQGDIHALPYGVSLPASTRASSTAPGGALRLVYAGRLEHGQKGVLDLPLIDRELTARGIAVHWTIIGAGPDEAALIERWGHDPRVRFEGAKSREDTLAQLSRFDVFVLPTRSEGFPVALVEAMGAGLVPVVSDIASGVPEIVDHDVNGFRPAAGDIRGFADAIAALARDSGRLEDMSRAARRAVAGRFDPRTQSRAYFDLFARLVAGRHPRRKPARVPYGSRLDRPWIPNPVTRRLRAWRTG